MGDEDVKDEKKDSGEEGSEERESAGSEIEKKKDDPDYKRTTDPEAGEKDTGECPDCGAPIDNVRVTCPNCGRQYEKDDYSDTEAGNEFRAGTAIDDEGKELPDDPSGN
ncbi:MAG: hypothetical protein QOH26_736 [Actinomycetota bacterium]|nr:hypothetical protein [Actinomycetota bacterium]